MSLSKKHVADVCMRWSSDSRTCRYIGEDSSDGKSYCFKLRPNEKKKIDNKIREFVKDCKKKGVDPFTQGVPLGDNCGGYLILKNIEQGYDK